MQALLPYLLILMCPVAMFFMMRGMHGRRAHAAAQHSGPGQQGIFEGPEDTEVAALFEQRDQLGARVEELEAQMLRLERAQTAEPRSRAPV
ncbi:MAG TPA: DUF2933 domain-containing protein [Thermoleophilia bacterium]|nr:DUF2933 domain-containing protein [Thermoleophilia bacterium]